ARSRGAHADHARDGARLLRAPAGEARVHALDGARLDHARGVSSGARPNALAGGRMTEQQQGAREELARRIEAIESGYEFLLAYAAQGRETDRGPGQGRGVREFLERMEQALDGLGAVVTDAARSAG